MIKLRQFTQKLIIKPKPTGMIRRVYTWIKPTKNNSSYLIILTLSSKHYRCGYEMSSLCNGGRKTALDVIEK